MENTTLEIKNCMEELVLRKIEENIDKLQVCRCELCKLDMAAMALNELPPKYVVSSKGEVYTRVNLTQVQYEIDIMRAITNASQIVKAFPNHD